MSGDGILGKRSDISLGLVLTNLIMHTDGRTVWKCRIVESVIGNGTTDHVIILIIMCARKGNVDTLIFTNNLIIHSLKKAIVVD